jgi:DNA-binding CsgD family transcriptional regulator
LPGRPVAGLARLSSRELDVVSRLLTGDRVPAIAQQLFLSQGTIRNHLSSAFAKLGVSSQQELIALLRPKPAD